MSSDLQRLSFSPLSPSRNSQAIQHFHTTTPPPDRSLPFSSYALGALDMSPLVRHLGPSGMTMFDNCSRNFFSSPDCACTVGSSDDIGWTIRSSLSIILGPSDGGGIDVKLDLLQVLLRLWQCVHHRIQRRDGVDRLLSLGGSNGIQLCLVGSVLFRQQ